MFNNRRNAFTVASMIIINVTYSYYRRNLYSITIIYFIYRFLLVFVHRSQARLGSYIYNIYVYLNSV